MGFNVVELPQPTPDLIAALEAAGLPTDDLHEPGRRFFRFEDDAGLIGYGGLEQIGPDALIRSMVVVDDRRGAGLGAALLSWLETETARSESVRPLPAHDLCRRLLPAARLRRPASFRRAARHRRFQAVQRPVPGFGGFHVQGVAPPMTRLRVLPDPDHMPALDPAYLSSQPALGLGPNDHPPRILLLYGSLRDRSFSRLCVEEAARLLRFMGCETRIFDPSDLPLTDQVDYDDHPAVHELREHALWSEGMVWSSPERHGQISGIMKLQIDHLPLNMGGMRPTQGRTLAVMQVSGGSQSFNAVNTLRLLGRWMRMITIPNQSSVAKAFMEFDENGRMKPSSYYDRIVDVMEELVRFTILTRAHAGQLVDRYSERKAAGVPIDAVRDLSAIAIGAAAA